MYLDYTPEQSALAAELRAYLAKLVTEPLRQELRTQEGGPVYKAALKQLAADRWLGVNWPVEYGGRGLTPMESFIFFDEVHRSGFPIPLLTLNTVGPTLMKYGTEAQRSEFLPRILRGEIEFSIGYTEPDAGTDLASITTKAVREGDEYVISGQKIFCSLADYTDYLWLAVRTKPESRHDGISILIVPTHAPGVSTTPIRNLGDNNIHALYLDNVRVPVSNVVGAENEGWKLITSQLNYERIALMMVGPLQRHLEEVTAWAYAAPSGQGGTMMELAWVNQALAKLDAKIEVLRLLNWRQAWNLGRDRLAMQEASGIKVFGSELYLDAYRTLMEIVGAASTLKAASDGVQLRGELERYHRSMMVLTFGGGVNEVQRDIIAMAGLRLPRAKR